MCVHAVGPVSTGAQGSLESATNRRRCDAGQDVFVRTRARVATTIASPAGATRNDTEGQMTALNPTFAKLGVRDEMVRALAENGIEHPFAIQELPLPLALVGDDLIGQARTGMGKTLAFGVPLLHRIVGAAEAATSGVGAAEAATSGVGAAEAATSGVGAAEAATSGGADTDRPLSGVPRALVVVPTRELCIQVSDDLSRAAKYLRANSGAQPPTSSGRADRPLSVVSIYGGRPYEPQIEALQAGADVVVGTPGRLLDLAQQGHLQLGGLSVLVLDEADEMLDLGFLPDIERILRQIPVD